MTELNGCVAQSHIAHDHTRRGGTGAPADALCRAAVDKRGSGASLPVTSLTLREMTGGCHDSPVHAS
ncbi:hypothetical protein GCM10022240_05190 [Microbacterium kribbense]|uniref:Uncharacterized protein n=1 Tax=Microbacterium kribbense TaxID=433645 RepID=A0ABP7G4S5_9MICO